MDTTLLKENNINYDYIIKAMEGDALYHSKSKKKRYIPKDSYIVYELDFTETIKIASEYIEKKTGEKLDLSTKITHKEMWFRRIKEFKGYIDFDLNVEVLFSTEQKEKLSQYKQISFMSTEGGTKYYISAFSSILSEALSSKMLPINKCNSILFKIKENSNYDKIYAFVSLQKFDTIFKYNVKNNLVKNKTIDWLKYDLKPKEIHLYGRFKTDISLVFKSLFQQVLNKEVNLRVIHYNNDNDYFIKISNPKDKKFLEYINNMIKPATTKNLIPPEHILRKLLNCNDIDFKSDNNQYAYIFPYSDDFLKIYSDIISQNEIKKWFKNNKTL